LLKFIAVFLLNIVFGKKLVAKDLPNEKVCHCGTLLWFFRQDVGRNGREGGVEV
jgi:hypothetical protein